MYQFSIFKNFMFEFIERIRIKPFIKEDLDFPCQLFAQDTYMCMWGCHIQRTHPEIRDDRTVHAGDTVVWTSNPRIHPKMYVSKHVTYF